MDGLKPSKYLIETAKQNIEGDITIDEVKKRGGEVVTLPITLADIHPRLQPLLLMQRFYLDIEAIAVAMGKNPDAPVGLNKVTITL